MHLLEQPITDSTVEAPLPKTSAWYALQMRYQCEKRADRVLRDQGFKTLCPFFTETHRWSDRRKHIETPMFPGYAFVHLTATPEACVEVLKTPGVVRFIGYGRALGQVSDQEIAAIERVVSSGLPCSSAEFLPIGAKIRVLGGCLDQLEGILLEIRGAREVVLSVGAIQRSIRVPIGSYQFERC